MFLTIFGQNAPNSQCVSEPDSVLPLTDYVFNTEAHPIPVIPHIQEDCCTTQDPSRQLLS